MDYFKLTMHRLADDNNCLTPGMLQLAQDELNTLRQTYLLYDATLVAQGSAMVCLWVQVPEPNAEMPLGFAVV